MNRNQLKFIALAAMLIDHISAFFVPTSTPFGFLMRIVGRLTAPIMCYFLAEGFRYTASHKKYGTRLFIFAVLSQFAYSFAKGQSILTPDFNMIFTLFLCFLMLLSYEKIKNVTLKTALIFLLIAVSFFSDWGIIAPMWVLSFYILHKDTKACILTFSLISLMHVIMSTASAISAGYSWHSQLWQIGVFLFVPLLLLYNGKNGKKNMFSKWFFYIFYPLHLIVIGQINNII